jgi:DNA-directed RNA polymerase sigma subunit (sigma70/sigma32)
MELPEHKIIKILKIAKEPLSMETPVGDDEDSTVAWCCYYLMISLGTSRNKQKQNININLMDQMGI